MYNAEMKTQLWELDSIHAQVTLTWTLTGVWSSKDLKKTCLELQIWDT